MEMYNTGDMCNTDDMYNTDDMETIELQQEKKSKLKETNSAIKKAGWFFFLLMILEIPLSILLEMAQRLAPVDYSTLISILMTQGYLLLGALVYVFVTKQRFGEDLMMKKYRLSSFFLSLVVLVTASPMANWLNVLSQFFVKNETGTAIYSITEVVPMWLGVLIIGCLPGFIEETIYRGIVYSAFRKRSVMTGIVVSALLFGLMHMNFNQMLYAVYLGVIFALVLEATGSLISTMILHMLFNAYNTASIYVLPKLMEFLGQYVEEFANYDIESAINATPTTQELLSTLVMTMPTAVIGLVLAILLIRKLAKINGRDFSWKYICGKKEEVKQTKPVNIPLILGCVFCLYIAVCNMLRG